MATMVRCHYKRCRIPFPVHRGTYKFNNWYCSSKCALCEQGEEGDQRLKFKTQLDHFVGNPLPMKIRPFPAA